MRLLTAFTLVGAFTLAAGCRTMSSRTTSTVLYDRDLGFAAFAAEALVGYATPRTHLFEDAAEGRYLVDPTEVVEQLPKVGESYGLQLDSVVVVGPYGPQRGYDVIAFVQEEACTRVSWLRMPFAFIMAKRSGCLSPERFAWFLTEMREITPLQVSPVDGRHCLVVAQGGRVRWSRFDCDLASSSSQERERMESALIALSKDLVLTYVGYPPEKKSDHN